jgi:serine/threonine protein kinase
VNDGTDSQKRIADDIVEVLKQGDGSPLAGRTINDRYQIDKLLGQGGMGMVYHGTDLQLGREVAIKCMGHVEKKDTDASDGDRFQRFRREAVSLSKVDHRNVVRVYDIIKTEDGEYYLVMEYVRGRSLAALLEERGRMSATEAVAIVRQVLEALEAIHAAGIVHRDLKPANIMLTGGASGATVKILDFGISKMLDCEDGVLGSNLGLADTQMSVTSIGTIVGTPLYLSPEQARGLPVDHRADLYTLGVILFQMLSGSTPFAGGRPRSVVARHVSEPMTTARIKAVPGNPISTAIGNVITTAMRKNPNDRYASAQEMRSALSSAAMNLEPFVAPRRAPGRSFAPFLAAFIVLMAAASAVYLKTRTPRDDWSRLVAWMRPAATEEASSAPVPGKLSAPLPVELTVENAEALIHDGRVVEAEVLLETIVTGRKVDPEAWYYLAQVKSRLLKEGEAKKAYQKFLDAPGRKDKGKIVFARTKLGL